MNKDNPFHRPNTPKNSLELLRWLIFEPILLQKYEKTLSKKETALAFLKIYPIIILISVLCYLMTSAIIAGFDFPLQFPKEFKPEILKQWISNDFAFNLNFFLKLTYVEFLKVLAFGLAFYLSYFRFIFYPIHIVIAFVNQSLRRNVYLNDAVIWLPLPHLKKKLLSDTWDESERAFDFADFLLEHRPLQRTLAFEIIHAATAATWYHHPLNPEELIFPRIDKEDKKTKRLLPSEEWFRLIETAKSELISAQKLNHISFKKDVWQRFHQTLQKLEKATNDHAGRWKQDYLEAIRCWIKESEKKLQEIEQDLQRYQPMAINIYRVGEPLTPEGFGKETFLGREDLREELSLQILSSTTMPTFLLQGQRRVGKTSLLNFLQERLGPRFMVICEDCQKHFSLSSIFNSLKSEAEKKLKLASEPAFPEEPLSAWKAFESYFSTLAQQKDYKIILGFDEYEELHSLLQKLGENGKMVLGAMRSFSQHQNQVVFLFTGLHLFADLGEPDFGRYFVHALRLKVDYLKKEDSIKLITQPYPEFRLIYPDELAEEMYRLTLGHPALLQHICSEMVKRANSDSKREMSNADLEKALESVLDRGNEVMTRFWIDFCKGSLKETVREIMDGKKPQHKADLLRLLDYGFITEDKEKSYKLRVPLFVQWIERHGESF